MTECDMFINNEFSNPTQTPPNMSIVSTTEENPVQAHGSPLVTSLYSPSF